MAAAVEEDVDVVGLSILSGSHLELELGLDSMERVELLTQLQVVFVSRVSEEVSHRIYTVRELVDAVLHPDAGGGEHVQHRHRVQLRRGF